MTVSRLEFKQARIKAGKTDSLGIPDLDGADYLLDAMFAVGPTRAAAMGDEPTGYLEIEAFSRATGRIDEPWEVEALRDMCVAYLQARQDGEHPLAIEPAKEIAV